MMMVVLSLVASVGVLLNVYMAGRNHPWTWRVGLGVEPLWIVFHVVQGNWGMAPLCVAMVGIKVHNMMKELGHE